MQWMEHRNVTRRVRQAYSATTGLDSVTVSTTDLCYYYPEWSCVCLSVCLSVQDRTTRFTSTPPTTKTDLLQSPSPWPWPHPLCYTLVVHAQKLPEPYAIQ